MYRTLIYKYYFITAFAIFGFAVFWNPLLAQKRVIPTDDEIEVLTRGPVHEAFAETIVFDPEPGLVIPRSPPAVIEELPPEHQPEGDNIAWIPGYWAPTSNGSQWTSGYWADAASEEIEYLPEPPATVEAGPNIPAPSADHSWLPGQLDLAAKRLCLAPRLLGPRPRGLELDSSPLRLDTSRLCIREWIL